MAWGRTGFGDAGLEPVELVEEDEPSGPRVTAGSPPDLHTATRTAAAAIAALALLWAGWSLSRQAAAERQAQCVQDVQQAYFHYQQAPYGPDGPTGEIALTGEVIDTLVAEARSCGADVYADAIDQARPPVDDD